MGLFDIIAILITLAAVFSYLNHKLFRLPPTIGLMILSLILSLVLVLVGQQFDVLDDVAHDLIGSIDFNRTLMQGMLGFLLFAGALHVISMTCVNRNLSSAFWPQSGWWQAPSSPAL